MNVTINHEQRLYVIPCGTGYSCLGFDVAFRKAAVVAAWLVTYGRPVENLDENLKGTKEGYEQYEHIMARGSEFNLATGKRCNADLVPELVGLEGKRVEVVDNEGERRRFYVGKSTGWFPCHLEIKTRRSMGGCAAMGVPFKSVRVVGR